MEDDKLIKHELEDELGKEADQFTSSLSKMIAHAVAEVLVQKAGNISKTEIINVPTTKVGNFPEVQKVAGEVSIKEKVDANISNFPEIQKIVGEVIAKVAFPEVQKVVGEVVAKVAFPEIQKVVGEVVAKVAFPEVQKVVGEMTLQNLPLGEGAAPDARKANPTKYVPVRLTNGARFYDIWHQISGNLANTRVSRLGVPPHDYIAVAYPDSSTEEFTYKSGGASGQVVAIVTVGYTSSAKTSISYVRKS